MRTVQLIFCLAALSAPALSQTADKAQVFSAVSLRQEFAHLEAQARTQGSSGTTVGDYGSHAIKLSLRTASGGAEVHAHFDDVIFVTRGQASLITGGTVIEPRTGSDGETKGKAVDGGTKQTISAGAVVHIPAGIPHQMLIPKGELFEAVVLKIREP